MKTANIVFLFLWTFTSNAQTEMRLVKNHGAIKSWNLVSGTNETVGMVWTIESNAKTDLLLYPYPSEFSGATLVVTGTYTSPNGKIAGPAYGKKCDQVGNVQDPYFKPNAWLVVERWKAGPFSLTSVEPCCDAIGLYQVLKANSVLESVVSARTNKTFQWRFLVRKQWSRKVDGGGSEAGVDWMIVDIEKVLNLADAVAIVQGLARNDDGRTYPHAYTSILDACLLDTGAYRPVLIDGKSLYGDFPQKQSNVLVIR